MDAGSSIPQTAKCTLAADLKDLIPVEMSKEVVSAGKCSPSTVAVVIVSFNSQKFLPKCLRSLAGQTRPPNYVVVVDSGSTDKTYLDHLNCEVVRIGNVGYCVANNIGWQSAKNYDYVLYLNPDAFPVPDFLERAVRFMDDRENARVGLLGGSLLRYDLDSDNPTGLVDSTGIVQKWYGRLVDRDSERPNAVLRKYVSPEQVPALCAAAVFCRNQALRDVAEGDRVFDPSYFMYKDDIDLSWRVCRAGWKLIYHPALIAYHCRGLKRRKETSREMLLLSARNEVKLRRKFGSPYLLYSLAKHLLVHLGI